MSKITYDDKVALNVNSNIADINKVNASDMNEIKQVVNDNDDSLNDLMTYSTNELIVGTWINNKPIYKKTFNFSIAGSSSTAGETITSYSALNIDMVIKTEGVAYIAGTNNAFRIIGQSTTPEGSENMRIYGTGSNVNFQRSLFTDDLNCYATIYYTKTTD